MFQQVTDYQWASCQSKLEHWSSKAHYPCTSGQVFTVQLSKIERRQHKIQEIHQKMNPKQAHKLWTELNDDEAGNPCLQYNIGKNQNSPVHLPTFLWKNEVDPALKVHWFLHHCSRPYSS